MIFEEFIFYVPAWGRLKQPFNKNLIKIDATIKTDMKKQGMSEDNYIMIEKIN